MCDQHTHDNLDAMLARRGLTRRQFAAMGATTALVACAPAGKAAASDLDERDVAIATADGTADGFFVAPAKGPSPGVIMWPDIAGLRDAYKVMARRLAGAGYAVFVPNPYYRSAKAPILNSLSEWFEPEKQARLKPMMALVDGAATARDATAFATWLDQQSETDSKRGIGVCGYCMGGSHAVRSAAAVPERIKAACSFHGAQLVTGKPDSPNLLMAGTKAHFLFAIGRDDDAKMPEEKAVLRAAAATDRPVEAEVYPADHGWCTLDAPSYDKPQAEKAWGRMLATFEAAL